MKILDPPEPRALPPEDREAQSSWLRRRGLALGLGLFCTIAAVVVLVEVGPKGLVGFGPQTNVVVPEASSSVFMPVVAHIYDVTNQAFQQRRVDLLETVYDTRCQCYQQAKQAIGQLLAAHQVLGGSGTRLTKVRLLARHTDVALLGVTDQVDPYPIYDEQGALVAHAPGRPSTSFTLTLELRGGQWLVKDVVSQINSLP
ncbi:MAG: hypothetical protein NVSMB32_07320 [Actinomycetota bacterium]